MRHVIYALPIALALAGCSAEEAPTVPEPAVEATAPTGEPAAAAPDPMRCRSHDPLRSAFFGDTHIHTARSMDAYTGDGRATPDDAYRFARGEPIPLAGGRTARLERPLDFAAVTDHAEFLGEVSVCTTAGSPAYDTEVCARFRGELPVRGGRSARMGGLLDQRPPLTTLPGFPPMGTPTRSAVLCADGTHCDAGLASVWEEIQAAAHRANQAAPDCGFTAFVAYEYSLTPELSKIHRNVIFRGRVVPARPTSWVEEPTPAGLWRELARQCLDAGTGCDALAIPHNPNLSNGRMFTLAYRDETLEAQREQARLRARVEPLVEIMQVKGDSECRQGMYQVAGSDELCGFEKFRHEDTPDCEQETGIGALGGVGCVSRLDFVRYALIEGLREQARIGVNPLKLGITAATDTHNATPGDTEEYSYQGAHGAGEATPAQRLSGAGEIVAPLRANPGGLMGVWAEENSRESLFEAMRRRETFGTSGVRIQPRLFAGWDLPEDLCTRTDWVAQAYATGVPMGSDLSAAPRSRAGPVFVAAATRDPGTDDRPGTALQRIQIVKGWSDDAGRFHQQVVDVAGEVDPLAGVDPQTCRPTGAGADQLCGVWRDPDFDPARGAVYYARVLENPSCRWSAWECLALDEAERPEACADPDLPREVQERAWTSPVWYSPG